MNKSISPLHHPMKGTIDIPGDKSISHRSIMFGALASGTTEITHFLKAEDCISTISCFRQMGVTIEEQEDCILVHGVGLHGLKRPLMTLFTGNSGTTTRLISGILAAQQFDCTLTGDSSIEKRPMKRIIQPLSMMGACIDSIHHNDCAPLFIHGTHLHGIDYTMPVASAQVKSAILLAGLYADEPTTITELVPSRNHTELMLKNYGCDITTQGHTITLKPGQPLNACKITVPSDISSAAYFIAAALLVPGSLLTLPNIGINPTRDGIIHVIQSMGGNIELKNKRLSAGEQIADLVVRYSTLHGTVIEGDIIPTLIDEIPLIAILSAVSKGTTIIRDAAELHYKECDRIEVMVENLKKVGIHATAESDGMIIEGSHHFEGGMINSYHDHRIAMSFAIAGLIAKAPIHIMDTDCISISYPEFFTSLEQLAHK